jgi:uncharacterized protein YjcR
MILPEIAAAYGRKEATIRWWRTTYDWPAPTGKRGRWDEYDPDAVAAAVRAILSIPANDGDPAELLDVVQAAAEAGIKPATIRGYISRGHWPAPDDEDHGVKRWRRDTVRAEMTARKPNKQRRSHS